MSKRNFVNSSKRWTTASNASKRSSGQKPIKKSPEQIGEETDEPENEQNTDQQVKDEL